ncbi:MAG: M28 family peptidase [Planctomycetota bacterium]|nr:M28 family peptidase [Planctomycetota bacterium]
MTREISDAGSSVSQERLIDTVRYLASDELEGRASGTDGSRKARAYIEEAFREAGLVPAGSDGYLQKIETGVGTNIIGRLDGADPPLGEEVVIVSAHYDHLGRSGDRIFPGADDNASGVAVMLEVARAQQALRSPLGRSILFIAFDSEEPPYFMTGAMGSKFFVNHPTVPIHRIAMMIGTDLLGTDPWPGWEGQLFVMGEEKCPVATSVLDAVAGIEGLAIRRLGIHMVEQFPIWGRHPFSDYAPFRDREIPFLFFTCGRPSFYHSPRDTADKLNYEKMSRIARFIFSTTVLASRTAESFRFERDGENLLSGAEVIGEGLEFVLDSRSPSKVFPGYTRLAWMALKWWRPKVRKILAKLRSGESIGQREIRVLERASLGLQSLTVKLLRR